MSREMAEIGRRGQQIDLLGGVDVDPVTGRLLSIAQLQAALRAHTLAAVPTAPTPQAAPPLASPQAPRRQGAMLLPGAAPQWPGSDDPTPHAPPGWVAVLGLHPGVGCSTIALAIADAAALAGVPAHLLQVGRSQRSGDVGLVAVTHDELGVVDGGWRRGRRGLVTLDRPAALAGTGSWPPPSHPHLGADPASANPVTVVDAGTADIDNGDGFPGPLASWWLPGGNGPAAVVVVCRASAPSIGITERMLWQLDNHLDAAQPAQVRLGIPQVLVAAVGGSRWRGPARVASGPHLDRLRQRHLLVGVPQVRPLEIAGPSADPLPRSVLAAGRTLWTLAGGPGREGAQR